jgi:hypothetical protein
VTEDGRDVDGRPSRRCLPRSFGRPCETPTFKRGQVRRCRRDEPRPPNHGVALKAAMTNWTISGPEDLRGYSDYQVIEAGKTVASSSTASSVCRQSGVLGRSGYVIERAANARRDLVQLGARDDEWGRDLQAAAGQGAREHTVVAGAKRDPVGETGVIGK